MPDIDHQPAPLWRCIAAKARGFFVSARPSRMLMIALVLIVLVLSGRGPALADDAPPGAVASADPHAYDIAVIIDNRRIAGRPSSKEEVSAIADMLDRHMFADHIIRLERPSFDVICDIFGGCPGDARPVWPSLIDQIAVAGQSRLYVYYLGPGRLEGRERQLLFADGRGRASPYAVGWLHKQLEKAKPRSGLVMIEASFAPSPLSCVSEDPLLIDEAMRAIQRNYARIMAGRSLPYGLAELSAAMPAEARHCDRYEFISQDVERPLFTKFVLDGVARGLADKDPFGDEDGAIEIGELAAYVQDNVRRAAQFQWGRRQPVWRTGPGGRTIASVEPRLRTWKENKARITLPVRTPPPEQAARPEPAPVQPEAPPPEDEPAKVETREKPPPRPAPRITRPNVCDVSQTSEACRRYCNDNPNDYRCLFAGSSPCIGLPESEECPCRQGDPRPQCSNFGNWCGWARAELAPSLRRLLGAQGDKACGWASLEEAEVAEEEKAFWKVFTPIGWRLARPAFRPPVACMLNCGGAGLLVASATDPVTAGLVLDQAPAIPELEPAPQPEPQPASESFPEPDNPFAISDPQPSEPTPRGPTTAFENEVCADALPPYIGLPRWMPGTLMISEMLRNFIDCRRTIADSSPVPLPTRPPAQRFVRNMPPPVKLPPAPPAEEVAREAAPVEAAPAPSPERFAKGLPPPVALLDPPPLPPARFRYREIAMPPPIELDPPTFTVSEIRWLQSALILGNHNPGPIDGRMGGQTITAIQSWRFNSDITPLDGPLQKNEFVRIVQEFGALFDQARTDAPVN